MIAVLLLAGALLVWPEGAARARLREIGGGVRVGAGAGAGAGFAGAEAGAGVGAVAGGSGVLKRLLGRVPVDIFVPASVGIVGLAVAGPLHACATALLAVTAVDLRRRAGLRRSRLARLGSWERALDDASSALRSGAGPEQALDQAASAAEPTSPDVAAILRSAQAHARLGGDVAAALRTTGDAVAVALAGAWLLSTRHGVVLAEVVDGLRADVAARRARAVRVGATLAGPRATAVILTALPALGVLLGSGFGADPLTVLLDGALGGMLCLVGSGFLAAGLAWTERIVDGASR